MRRITLHTGVPRWLAVASVGLAGAGLLAYEAAAQQPSPPPPPPPGPGGLAAPGAFCRAKPEPDCAITEGCVWIPGFRVPNGTEIPGYCRPAPRDFKARRGTQEHEPQ